MAQGERNPLTPSQENIEAGNYIPRYPINDDDALKIIVDLDNEFMQPEKLSPTTLYSMVLTRNECSLMLHKQSPLELADALRENFQLGLQAMMRSTQYNQQEHGELRADLFEGYLQQLRILQEHSLERRVP